MTNTYTKDEAEDLRNAAREIELFLRLVALRIENKPDAIPFKPERGQLVIGWMRSLAHRYAMGEDITK